MGYWLYFAIFMLYTHSNVKIVYQFGNILMFFTWYLFFAEMALVYYYICVKLSSRYEYIKDFLKNLKDTKPIPIDNPIVMPLEKPIKASGHYYYYHYYYCYYYQLIQ